MTADHQSERARISRRVPEHWRTDAARDVVHQSESSDANVGSASRVWLGGRGGGRWKGAGGSLLFPPLNQKVYEYYGMPAVGILKNRGGGNIREENRNERHQLLSPLTTPHPPRYCPDLLFAVVIMPQSQPLWLRAQAA